MTPWNIQNICSPFLVYPRFMSVLKMSPVLGKTQPAGGQASEDNMEKKEQCLASVNSFWPFGSEVTN